MLYYGTFTLHCLKWSRSLWCHQGSPRKKRAFHLSWNVFSCLISEEAWLINNSMYFISLPARWEYFAVFLPLVSLAACVESVFTHTLHRLQIKCTSVYLLHWKISLWKWAWSYLSSPPPRRWITTKWD